MKKHQIVNTFFSGILIRATEAAVDFGMEDANLEKITLKTRRVAKLSVCFPRVPKLAFCRKIPVPARVLTTNGILIWPSQVVLPLFMAVV